MIEKKPTERRTKGSANAVDAHVGARVRMRRSLLGISQEKLAEALGITFQQIQKYERGANRVSASRLYQLGKILDVPVSFFFEQYETTPARAVAVGMSDSDQEPFGHDAEDVMNRRETMKLVRVYYSITDPKARRDVVNIMKTMAAMRGDSNL